MSIEVRPIDDMTAAVFAYRLATTGYGRGAVAHVEGINTYYYLQSEELNSPLDLNNSLLLSTMFVYYPLNATPSPFDVPHMELLKKELKIYDPEVSYLAIEYSSEWPEGASPDIEPTRIVAAYLAKASRPELTPRYLFELDELHKSNPTPESKARIYELQSLLTRQSLENRWTFRGTAI